MRINTILQKVDDLDTISVDDTVGHALSIIEDKGLLSLPVVEKKGSSSVFYLDSLCMNPISKKMVAPKTHFLIDKSVSS